MRISIPFSTSVRGLFRRIRLHSTHVPTVIRTRATQMPIQLGRQEPVTIMREIAQFLLHACRHSCDPIFVHWGGSRDHVGTGAELQVSSEALDVIPHDHAGSAALHLT